MSSPSSAAPASGPDPARVLAKASLDAAERLGLGRPGLARVIGASEATLSRAAKSGIDPESKRGELTLLFVRLYRSLDALVGGDDLAARAWLHAENPHLGGQPAELVARAEGLVRVLRYLDAMRGRL